MKKYNRYYFEILSRTKVDTLAYFSSAAIAFAFKTCQIFAIGAFVIWRIIFHVSYPILPLFSVIYVFRGRYAVGNCISEL